MSMGNIVSCCHIIKTRNRILFAFGKFRKSAELTSNTYYNKVPLTIIDFISLIIFASYVTRLFYFHFFILKFPSYEKLAMTSQFDLTRFYDAEIRNSAF